MLFTVFSVVVQESASLHCVGESGLKYVMVCVGYSSGTGNRYYLINLNANILCTVDFK